MQLKLKSHNKTVYVNLQSDLVIFFVNETINGRASTKFKYISSAFLIDQWAFLRPLQKCRWNCFKLKQ